MQLFVKGFHGETTSFHIVYGARVSDVLDAIGVPAGLRSTARIRHEGRILDAGSRVPLVDLGVAPVAVMELCCPLLGGKGGFGSNLRAAGKMKLTDNFDACRDLSGRRIRQQEVEKKLAEWQAQSADRALEAVALKYAKEETKKARARERLEVDVEAVTAEHRAELRSVMEGLADTVTRAHRAQLEGAPLPEHKAAAKRRRMDPLLQENFSDDSDAESDDTDGRADRDEGAQPLPAVGAVGPPPTGEGSASGDFDEGSSGHSAGTAIPGGEGAKNDDDEACARVGARRAEDPRASPPPTGAEGTPAIVSGDGPPPLNLEKYATAEDLEVVGLDRLKSELSCRGLKAGGTLKQRAERLFLLKSIPLESLSPRHFAKAS